jgi:hypothetical protein
MRRIIVFLLCSILFATAGFFLLPAATQESVALFVANVFRANRAPESDGGWPLLAIDSGAAVSRVKDITATAGEQQYGRWQTVHGEPAPALPLKQALSFQMSLPRILGNWPQVSTGIKEDGLFGYRVPLVSGTRESDITGALTYFFGSDQVLYRIEFKGDTGDARKLIAYLSNGFQMQRQRSAEQGVFLYQTPGEVPVVGELRICPRTIIHNAHPHQRFEVSLQLSRFSSENVEL